MPLETKGSVDPTGPKPHYPLFPSEKSNKTFNSVSHLIDQLNNSLAVQKPAPTVEKVFDNKSVAKFESSKFSTSELKAVSLTKYKTTDYECCHDIHSFDQLSQPIANNKWIAAVGYFRRENKIVLVDRESGKQHTFPYDGKLGAMELTDKTLILVGVGGKLTFVDLENLSVTEIDSKQVEVYNKPISIHTFKDQVTISSKSKKNQYSVSSYSIKNNVAEKNSELTINAEHVSVYDNLVVYIKPEGRCVIKDLSTKKKIHDFQISDANEGLAKIECCRLIGSKLCVEYSKDFKKNTIKIFDVKDNHREILIKRFDEKSTSWMRKVKGHYFLGNEEIIYHPRMKGYDLRSGKRIGRRPSFQYDAEGERSVMGNLDPNTGKCAEWIPGLHTIRIHDFKPLKENNPFLRAVAHTMAASAFLTSTPFFIGLIAFVDFRYKTAYHTALANHYFKVYKANYKHRHKKI